MLLLTKAVLAGLAAATAAVATAALPRSHSSRGCDTGLISVQGTNAWDGVYHFDSLTKVSLMHT